MQLWLVGRFIAKTEAGTAWDFAGIFSDQVLAIAACRDENYAVAPIVLNEQPPHESQEFEVCWYPHSQPSPPDL
jgi:hypothetical protein